MSTNMITIEGLAQRILLIRGQKAMLDADLAELYGVPTKRFNEQFKRNIGRFPVDFMFQLTDEEHEALRPQFATSNTGRSGRRYAQLMAPPAQKKRPIGFTAKVEE